MSSYRVKLGFWSAVAGMVGILVGCQGPSDKSNQGASPDEGTATNAAERAAGGAAAAHGAVGSPTSADVPLDRIDEANFQLAWTLDSRSAESKVGSGNLVLVAKAPFKPNQDYPHKFKL